MRQGDRVEIRRAGPGDVPHLAQLLHAFASEDEQARRAPEAFAGDLRDWWQQREQSHHALLAVDEHDDQDEPIGMVWLAVVDRVPRPGSTSRRGGDLQSLFVLPGHRTAGVGTALVEAASRLADQLQLAHVTVQAGPQSADLLRRVGYAAHPDLLRRQAD